MDNPLLSTPASDTIFEESDDSTQSESSQKDDSVILAQPAIYHSVTPLIPFTDPQNAKNSLAQDAQDPPLKNDENLLAPDAQDPLA